MDASIAAPPAHRRVGVAHDDTIFPPERKQVACDRLKLPAQYPPTVDSGDIQGIGADIAQEYHTIKLGSESDAYRTAAGAYIDDRIFKRDKTAFDRFKDRLDEDFCIRTRDGTRSST